MGLSAEYRDYLLRAFPGNGTYNRSAVMGSPGSPAPVVAPPINLDEERAKILALFQMGRQAYDSPAAQTLESQIAARSSGQSRPFDQNVLAGMYSQNADSAAGGFGAERDMIRMAMANQGLSGSGMETSAILSAMRRQGQQVRTGRRDISTRAALENFGAAERAQAQGMEYLRQRAAYQQQGAFAEAGYRSTLQEPETQGQPGGQVIQAGNAWGPAPPKAPGGPQFMPTGNVFDPRSYDRMIQQMSFANSGGGLMGSGGGGGGSYDSYWKDSGDPAGEAYGHM